MEEEVNSTSKRWNGRAMRDEKRFGWEDKKRCTMQMQMPRPFSEAKLKIDRIVTF